ncbi:MAG TPA: hypothetical protein PLA68_08340 [Panacibacter sp.]|nr:hypothetical protein [Panacibacter sp.]
MKKILSLKIVCLIVFAVLFMHCEAQPPLPDMYVDRDAATERKASFIVKSQFLLIDNKIDTKDSIFFPEKSFSDMLHHFAKLSTEPVGLRVVFAQFPENTSGHVPENWENQLTILFSPIVAGNHDTEFYFINDHGNFNPTDNKLSNAEAKLWISNYENNIIPTIKNTINDDDDKNYISIENRRILSDTKSIDYCAAAIKQFADEIKYQNNIHNDQNFITGVRCYFCAYGKRGITLQDGSRHYKKRLIIQLAITTKDEEVFDIDTTNRKPKLNACPLAEKVLPKFSSAYDNGQLCPANCPTK